MKDQNWMDELIHIPTDEIIAKSVAENSEEGQRIAEEIDAEREIHRRSLEQTNAKNS